MSLKSIKSLLAGILSIFLLLFSSNIFAQEQGKPGENPAVVKNEGFNAKKVIFGHIMDAHEFHFMEFKGSDGQKHPIAIPLPVFVYSPQKGF